MTRYIIISILLCLSTGLSAQLKISGGWSKDTVVIGDEVTLTLSVEADTGVTILAVSGVFLDSVYSALASIKAQIDTSQPLIPKIADFELLNMGNWTDPGEDDVFAGDELAWTTAQAGSKTLYENTFKFRLWDPGEIIALYPPIIYTDGTTQEQYVEEGQMKTIVAPPGGINPQDSIGLADIKPILTEKVQLSDYLIYFIIIGLALIIGLGYWLFIKYYKQRSTDQKDAIMPEVIIPAHEIALSKLSDLRDQELWQQGNIKQYQSELTYIIREYLENRYDILALESTTDEVVQLIKDQLLSDDVTSLKRILQVADLVKFAKATPDTNVHDSFMEEAVKFVAKTKLEEEEPEI